MNQPHPHAASMLLYAQDAAETDTPWERWECKDAVEGWYGLTDHPVWGLYISYRRKPRTILVNGIEIPEPMRKEPRNTDEYYLAYPIFEELFLKSDWAGTKTEKMWLKKGLLHSTREAAIAHAKAMLAPSQRNQSEY